MMKDDNVSIAISVVLYKTPVRHIERLFSSLSLLRSRSRVYIIDNSPTTELKQYLPENYVASYIHRPDNPGYGAGHNIAIRQASETCGSPYHLVLNADVYFDYDITSPMLSYMDMNPDVGMMMPKILNPNGTIQYLCKLCPNPIDLLLRGFIPNKYFKKMRGRFELRGSNYDRIMFVPYLSGCFMLLRRSALDAVGMFDERYFMYPEDIDLTRRIAIEYRTLFFPNVFAYHEHGAASKKSLKMFMIHFANLVKYFNKWGWFFDSDRRRLNKKAVSLLRQDGAEL